jgi:VWFA-related protein
MRPVTVSLVVAALAVALLPAQDNPAQDNKGNGTSTDRSPVDFVIQTRQIMAPTTVLDRDGNLVTGLRPSDFELRDNGKVQEIQVDETFAPLSIVVAVQANAKSEKVLPKIQKLASMFESMLAGGSGEIALLAFDHRFQELTPFTNDVTKLEEGLKKLRPGSSSNMMVDAVAYASRMLRNRPRNNRRIILLISESRDLGSAARLRETLTTVQVENVMIYALNMSRLYNETMASVPYPRPDPIPAGARASPAGGTLTPTTQAQLTGTQGYGANFVPLFEEIFRAAKAIFVDNPAEVLTKYTGGREIGFVSERALQEAVSDIGREIHNQYLITYNPSNKQEGGFHNIDVIVRRPGLTVRTRPGYWLAAVQ